MRERPVLFNGETWLPVRNYEGRYEVSDLGIVRSLSTYHRRSGQTMTPWVSSRGYLYLSLRSGKEHRKTFAVHRLVLEAFCGPRPRGKQVAHWDGDPTNNRLSNLRWASAKENIADRSRHGRTKCGEENGSAKLDRALVKTIKRLRFSGLSAYETGRLACVHPSTISAIWEGRTWKHVQ